MAILRHDAICNNIPFYIPTMGTFSGIPESSSELLDYKSNPLTNYERAAYNVEYEHVLCPRCYSKVYNKARFGLCAECFNDGINTLYVMEAQRNYVYLSRRGRRIKITGDQVKIPVSGSDGRIKSKRKLMEVPYLNLGMVRLGTHTPVHEINVSEARTVRLKSAHGTLPLDYLLAELD